MFVFWIRNVLICECRTEVSRIYMINQHWIKIETVQDLRIEFTWIPFSAHSFENALLSCITPPLEAAYGVMFLPPMNEIMLAMLIIFPGRPSARFFFANSWQETKVALKLMSSTASISSSVNSAASDRLWIPAQFRRISAFTLQQHRTISLAVPNSKRQEYGLTHPTKSSDRRLESL